MRRSLSAVAGLFLALSLPMLASAHEITDVQVDCDGQAIHVSGKLFGQDGGATVTVTGPDGYSESFLADQDEEWTVTLPLGPDGAYVIDWPESGDFGPVDFTVECIDEDPEPTPTPTPTPTPAPAQFAFPTMELLPCVEPGGQGAIVLSGFAATNGGELVIDPGAGETVITDNGTYPLDPGTHTAIVRFEGETVAGPTEFTIAACPTETVVLPDEGTPAPTGEVLPGIGTDGGSAPTLPPTDTAGSPTGAESSPALAGLVLFGLAASLAWVSLAAIERRMEQRQRSRSRARGH
jgi:hypothetical protein